MQAPSSKYSVPYGWLHTFMMFPEMLRMLLVWGRTYPEPKHVKLLVRLIGPGLTTLPKFSVQMELRMLVRTSEMSDDYWRGSWEMETLKAPLV